VNENTFRATALARRMGPTQPTSAALRGPVFEEEEELRNEGCGEDKGWKGKNGMSNVNGAPTKSPHPLTRK